MKKTLHQRLQEKGLASGTVYASSIMKAADVVRAAADFRAQESIRATTERILRATGCRVV